MQLERISAALPSSNSFPYVERIELCQEKSVETADEVTDQTAASGRKRTFAELFEFVDQVGSYGSAWWLDAVDYRITASFYFALDFRGWS